MEKVVTQEEARLAPWNQSHVTWKQLLLQWVSLRHEGENKVIENLYVGPSLPEPKRFC